MKRIGAVTAGAALAASFGFAGAAGAATPPPNTGPGSVFTLELGEFQANPGAHSYACNVLTFGAGGTFTGSRYGDSGTYRVSGDTISIRYTAGADYPSVFKGTWAPRFDRYRGTWVYGGNQTFWAGLFPGADNACG